MLRPQELDRQYAPVVTTDVWSATWKLSQRCATPPLTSAVCCWVLVQQRVRGLTLSEARHTSVLRLGSALGQDFNPFATEMLHSSVFPGANSNRHPALSIQTTYK